MTSGVNISQIRLIYFQNYEKYDELQIKLAREAFFYNKLINPVDAFHSFMTAAILLV